MVLFVLNLTGLKLHELATASSSGPQGPLGMGAGVEEADKAGSCCGAKTKVLPFEGGDDEDAGSTFGPLDQRECRDVIFLIIFIAFLGGVV
ncbi:hypothetical protein MAR_037820, partial [Mya arenaria]